MDCTSKCPSTMASADRQAPSHPSGRPNETAGCWVHLVTPRTQQVSWIPNKYHGETRKTLEKCKEEEEDDAAAAAGGGGSASKNRNSNTPHSIKKNCIEMVILSRPTHHWQIPITRCCEFGLGKMRLESIQSDGSRTIVFFGTEEDGLHQPLQPYQQQFNPPNSSKFNVQNHISQFSEEHQIHFQRVQGTHFSAHREGHPQNCKCK